MIDAADLSSRSTTTRRGCSPSAPGSRSQDIAARVEALIVTLGADGSRIHAGGERDRRFRRSRPTALVDPTGCGDAYRAGLLYGIAHGWDWERTGRLAALLGSLKIASRGGQNHAVDRERRGAALREHFGGYALVSAALPRRPRRRIDAAAAPLLSLCCASASHVLAGRRDDRVRLSAGSARRAAQALIRRWSAALLRDPERRAARPRLRRRAGCPATC